MFNPLFRFFLIFFCAGSLQAGEFSASLPALMNAGDNAINEGDYGAALKYFEQAGQEAAVQQNKRAEILARSYAGDAWLSLQRPGMAWKQLDKALGLAEEFGDAGVLAHVLNNLANLYRYDLDKVAAAGVYEHAWEQANKAAEHSLAAQILVNQIRNAQDAGEYAGAVQYWEKARSNVKHLAGGQERALFLLALADSGLRLSAAGHPVAVHPLLQEAEQIAQELQDKRLLSYAKGYLAELYRQADKPVEALHLARQAVFFAQGVPDALFRWEWLSARLLQEKNELNAARQAYERALKHVHGIRGRLMSGRRDAREVFREYIRPVYFSLTDVLLQQAATADAGESAVLLKKVRDILELLRAAELEDYFQDACVANVRAGLPQQSIIPPADTAVVYPVLLPGRIELLLMLHDGIHQIRVPADTGEVTRTVIALQHKLQIQTRWEFAQQAQQLYHWLITPMLGKLGGVENLIIVPDGALRTIPMGALYDGKQYLLEQFAVAVTPGMDLTNTLPSPQKEPDIFLNGLTSAVQNFSALPDVKKEIGNIKGLFSKANVLFDKEFLLDSFNDVLENDSYRVVHIASHGIFSRDPGDTFILTYDSKLTLDRLENLIRFNKIKQESVELLTLSACQTAVGDERAALGLAGVAVKSGVKSALASLWYVSDEATSLLMADFYRNLKDPEIGKAQALRKAQTTLLQQRRFNHPIFWAPFILIGNWL